MIKVDLRKKATSKGNITKVINKANVELDNNTVYLQINNTEYELERGQQISKSETEIEFITTTEYKTIQIKDIKHIAI